MFYRESLLHPPPDNTLFVSPTSVAVPPAVVNPLGSISSGFVVTTSGADPSSSSVPICGWNQVDLVRLILQKRNTAGAELQPSGTQPLSRLRLNEDVDLARKSHVVSMLKTSKLVPQCSIGNVDQVMARQSVENPVFAKHSLLVRQELGSPSSSPSPSRIPLNLVTIEPFRLPQLPSVSSAVPPVRSVIQLLMPDSIVAPPVCWMSAAKKDHVTLCLTHGARYNRDTDSIAASRQAEADQSRREDGLTSSRISSVSISLFDVDMRMFDVILTYSADIGVDVDAQKLSLNSVLDFYPDMPMQQNGDALLGWDLSGLQIALGDSTGRCVVVDVYSGKQIAKSYRASLVPCKRKSTQNGGELDLVGIQESGASSLRGASKLTSWLFRRKANTQSDEAPKTTNIEYPELDNDVPEATFNTIVGVVRIDSMLYAMVWESGEVTFHLSEVSAEFLPSIVRRERLPFALPSTSTLFAPFFHVLCRDRVKNERKYLFVTLKESESGNNLYWCEIKAEYSSASNSVPSQTSASVIKMYRGLWSNILGLVPVDMASSERKEKGPGYMIVFRDGSMKIHHPHVSDTEAGSPLDPEIRPVGSSAGAVLDHSMVWSRLDEYRCEDSRSQWVGLDDAVKAVLVSLGDSFPSVLGLSRFLLSDLSGAEEYKWIAFLLHGLRVPGRYSDSVIAKTLRWKGDCGTDIVRMSSASIPASVFNRNTLVSLAEYAVKDLMQHSQLSAEECVNRILKRATRLALESDAMVNHVSFIDSRLCSFTETKRDGDSEDATFIVPLVLHKDHAIGGLRHVLDEERVSLFASLGGAASRPQIPQCREIVGSLAASMAASASLQIASSCIQFLKARNENPQMLLIRSLSLFVMSMLSNSCQLLFIRPAELDATHLRNTLSSVMGDLSRDRRTLSLCSGVASSGPAGAPLETSPLRYAASIAHIAVEESWKLLVSLQRENEWTLSSAANDIFEVILNPSEPRVFAFLTSQHEYGALGAIAAVMANQFKLTAQIAAALSAVQMLCLKHRQQSQASLPVSAPSTGHDFSLDDRQASAAVVDLCVAAGLQIEKHSMERQDEEALEDLCEVLETIEKGLPLDPVDSMRRAGKFLSFQIKLLLARVLERSRLFGSSRGAAILASACVSSNDAASKRDFELARNIAFGRFLDANDMASALNILLVASSPSYQEHKQPGAEEMQTSLKPQDRQKVGSMWEYDDERSALRDAVVLLVNAVADQGKLEWLAKVGLPAPATRMVSWALAQRARLGDVDLSNRQWNATINEDRFGSEDDSTDSPPSAYEQWVSWQMARGDTAGAACAALEWAKRLLECMNSNNRGMRDFAVLSKLAELRLSALTLVSTVLSLGGEPFVPILDTGFDLASSLVGPSVEESIRNLDIDEASTGEGADLHPIGEPMEEAGSRPHSVGFRFSSDAGSKSTLSGLIGQCHAGELPSERDPYVHSSVLNLEDGNRLRLLAKAQMVLTLRALYAKRVGGKRKAGFDSGVSDNLVLDESYNAIEWTTLSLCAKLSGVSTESGTFEVGHCGSCLHLAMKLATVWASKLCSDRLVRHVVTALSADIMSTEQSCIRCSACAASGLHYSAIFYEQESARMLLTRLEEWRLNNRDHMNASSSYFVVSLEHVLNMYPTQVDSLPSWLIECAAFGSGMGVMGEAQEPANGCLGVCAENGGNFSKTVRVLAEHGRSDLLYPIALRFVDLIKNDIDRDQSRRDLVCFPGPVLDALLVSLRSPKLESLQDESQGIIRDANRSTNMIASTFADHLERQILQLLAGKNPTRV